MGLTDIGSEMRRYTTMESEEEGDTDESRSFAPSKFKLKPTGQFRKDPAKTVRFNNQANSIEGCDDLVKKYLDPVFVHAGKIKDDGSNDHADEKENEDPNVTVSTEEESKIENKCGNSHGDLLSAEDKIKATLNKSTAKLRSAAKSKSTSKPNSKKTMSRKLLQISAEDNVAMVTGKASVEKCLPSKGCFCDCPWTCPSLFLSDTNGVNNIDVKTPRTSSGGKQTSSSSSVFDYPLTGWVSMSRSKSSSASTAREASKRKKGSDPPVYQRTYSDSSKYMFKHFQDWRSYLEEYRHRYTFNAPGAGMKSHLVAEEAGHREAVVIVRTISDNARSRPRDDPGLDWEDFTDLSATPMRPLHIIPSYKSGKFPDMGITWLSAAAHHEAQLSSGYPTTRHIKLTTVRSTDTMSSQNKKRQSCGDGGRMPRVEAISPHDGGIRIPCESLHIVEDFRGINKDKCGSDMRSIGFRFLTNWHPDESTDPVSQKKSDRKDAESKPASRDGSHRSGTTKNSGRSLHPLMTKQFDHQTRAGLLKLFMPPNGVPTGCETDEAPRGQSSVNHSKIIDAAVNGVGSAERIQRSKTEQLLRTNSPPKRVNASNWTSLLNSNKKEKQTSDVVDRKRTDDNKHSSSKSKRPQVPSEKSAVDRQSVPKSGTNTRKYTLKPHLEIVKEDVKPTNSNSLQKGLLLVKGEKRTEGAKSDGSAGDAHPENAEKYEDVFSKARLKLVPPFAKPLPQDTVLIGSHYGHNSHFLNEGLNTS